MRILVLVELVQQRVATYPWVCTTCGLSAFQVVVRRYMLARLFFPVSSGPAHYVATCSACSYEHPTTAPPGAPGRPFMHTFGFLVQGALVLAAFGVYFAATNLSSLAARAGDDRAAEVDAALAEYNRAAAELVQSEQDCVRATNGALGVVAEEIKKGKPRKPEVRGDLVGARYGTFVLGDAPFVTSLDALQVQNPGGPYFGEPLCKAPPIDPPRPITSRTDPARIRAATERARASAARLPEDNRVVSLVALDCPDRGSACAATAVWVSVPRQRILGSVRAQGRPAEGFREQRANAVTALREVTAGWGS